MAIVRPFAALRPPKETVARVAAPPYDVVNTAEARALREGNDDTFLRISRPEVDLPEGTDEHSDAVYAQGKTALDALVEQGALIADDAPHFYVYAQQMGAHRQVGLVACASCEDYDQDIIKKHEKTRPDKEDDRTRHIDELGAHDEPVFLTYPHVDPIDALVKSVTDTEPTYDFVTEDEVGHTLWVVDPATGEKLEAAFAEVPALYVADGHHRSAAASRVHAKRKGTGGDHGHFLAVIFPDDQMQILAYNRVVKDPEGRDAAALLAELSTRFDVVPTTEHVPSEPRTFTAYLAGAWYLCRVRPETVDENDPVASLDAALLQDQLLAPVFGIENPRTAENIAFVGGIRGPGELVKHVDSGDFDLGIHLFPTSITQLIAVSDAGLLMPPKSTWFEPKLRSGLFVHRF